MARTQDNELLHTLQDWFKYIENESFESSFLGLFFEINPDSEKLGKNYNQRNEKLCKIIQKIAEGIANFSTDTDILGDAYEYLIGQFAAGSGKKAGEFYTPQQISNILSQIVTLDSQDQSSCKKKKLDNASEYFEKEKRQNKLLDVHINKIVDTYQFRKVEDRYSRRVSIEEIEEKNDFNLNISRYISTSTADKEIDLHEVHISLMEAGKEVAKYTDEHNQFLKELNLKGL
jgi:type I restriction-modification system DNA methylase subunit